MVTSKKLVVSAAVAAVVGASTFALTPAGTFFSSTPTRAAGSWWTSTPTSVEPHAYRTRRLAFLTTNPEWALPTCGASANATGARRAIDC